MLLVFDLNRVFRRDGRYRTMWPQILLVEGMRFAAVMAIMAAAPSRVFAFEIGGLDGRLADRQTDPRVL
jgi:hypothetical protein